MEGQGVDEGWSKTTENMQACQKGEINPPGAEKQSKNPQMPVIAVIPSVPFNLKFKQRNIHFQTSNFCMAHYVYKVLYMLSLKHGSNITPTLQRDK